MSYYIFLFVIPLIAWLAIGKLIFKCEFSMVEILTQGALTFLVLVLLVVAGNHSQTRDYKMVNGIVTALDAKKETCPIGWSDWTDDFCTEYTTRMVPDGKTCTTSADGKRTCTTKYKTQYNYIYPWEQRYFVSSTISKYEIKRIDRQGVNTPPRYSEINLNDPVTALFPYTNYIKGAANTLFNQKYEEVPPISYPKVYDYYKVRRVIYHGAETDNSYVKKWNDELSVLNSDIRDTGANVIIGVTGFTEDWSERLAQAWDAHNINDIVVIIGVDEKNIQWVNVRSWSENDIVNITIRDEIMNLKVVDKARINDIIKTYVEKYYKQQPMENFEYLADDIPPPTWMIVLAAIILLIVTPTITYFLSKPQIKNSFVRR